MPELSTRILARRKSSAMNLAKSADESPTGRKPRGVRFWSANALVFTIAENSALSFLTISGGVPLGANMPNQV